MSVSHPGSLEPALVFLFDEPFTSKDCKDIEECSSCDGNGNCSYQYSKSVGSFNCSCPNGYQLGDDILRCFDFNECLVNKGSSGQKCVNLLASYESACHDGNEKIGKNGTNVVCKDIGEKWY